ncbi:unnamed protein product [Boreogadus saida]
MREAPVDPGSFVKFDSRGGRKATRDRGGRGKCVGRKGGCHRQKAVKVEACAVHVEGSQEKAVDVMDTPLAFYKRYTPWYHPPPCTMISAGWVLRNKPCALSSRLAISKRPRYGESAAVNNAARAPWA